MKGRHIWTEKGVTFQNKTANIFFFTQRVHPSHQHKRNGNPEKEIQQRNESRKRRRNRITDAETGKETQSNRIKKNISNPKEFTR